MNTTNPFKGMTKKKWTILASVRICGRCADYQNLFSAGLSPWKTICLRKMAHQGGVKNFFGFIQIFSADDADDADNQKNLSARISVWYINYLRTKRNIFANMLSPSYIFLYIYSLINFYIFFIYKRKGLSANICNSFKNKYLPMRTIFEKKSAFENVCFSNSLSSNLLCRRMICWKVLSASSAGGWLWLGGGYEQS